VLTIARSAPKWRGARDSRQTTTPSRGLRESVAHPPAKEKERPDLTSDRTITCADCGQEFVFSASEQQFYADRGFSDPRRCPNCRQQRKAQRGNGGGGYSSGGYGGYDMAGGGGGGYRERGPREMFEATCSNCGKTASVPFRPTSGKPVYCDDCFRSRRG
jgi:CxxC-x17-CxxC domain-containing protein